MDQARAPTGDRVTGQTIQVDVHTDGTPFDGSDFAMLSLDGAVGSFGARISNTSVATYERLLPFGITFPAVVGGIFGSPSIFGLRVATIYGPENQAAVTDVPRWARARVR